MKKEMKDLLGDAFDAPKPKNKKDFLRNIRPREVSILEMLLQQAAYIRIPVWLFAIVIVVFAIGGSLLKMKTTASIITMIMPYSAAIAVMETKRSVRCDMTELEMATRFSLRSVVFARMTVLGIVSFMIICIASPVIAIAFQNGTLLMAMRILIPYFITMIISLQVERRTIGRRTGYASLAIATIMAILIYWFTYFEPIIVIRYLGLIESWGVFITAGLLALMIEEQWKTIKNVEAFA